MKPYAVKQINVPSRWPFTRWFSELQIIFFWDDAKEDDLLYKKTFFGVERTEAEITLNRLESIRKVRTWRDWIMFGTTKSLFITADDNDLKHLAYYGVPREFADKIFRVLSPYTGQNYTKFGGS